MSFWHCDGNQLIAQVLYLDVPISLIEDHLHKLGVLEGVQEVGVETVEVGLNAHALHHQVLRHPRHELFLHSLFQLLNLKGEHAYGFKRSL